MTEVSELTEAQRELFDFAQREGTITLEEVLSPPWHSEEPRHWTTYVPDEIYRHWDQLPVEGRLIAYVAA